LAIFVLVKLASKYAIIVLFSHTGFVLAIYDAKDQGKRLVVEVYASKHYIAAHYPFIYAIKR